MKHFREVRKKHYRWALSSSKTSPLHHHYIFVTNSKVKMDIGHLTWRQDSPSLTLCEKGLQPQTGNRSSQADRLVKRADVDALDESEYICSSDSLFTFQSVSVYTMILVLHVRLFMNSFYIYPFFLYRILLYFLSNFIPIPLAF